MPDGVLAATAHPNLFGFVLPSPEHWRFRSFDSGAAFGVGQDPDPFPSMRRTGVGSSHNSPNRRHPQRGKVPEYSVKPPRSEHWAVLHEREPGLYLANDPGHFGPQSASFPVKSVSLSGDADVLTGEPSADDVNVSPPRSTVEGSHIVPHGELGEHSVPLSGKQDAPGVGSKLNSADTSPSEQVPAKDSATRSGEQCKFSHLLLR